MVLLSWERYRNSEPWQAGQPVKRLDVDDWRLLHGWWWCWRWWWCYDDDDNDNDADHNVDDHADNDDDDDVDSDDDAEDNADDDVNDDDDDNDAMMITMMMQMMKMTSLTMMIMTMMRKMMTMMTFLRNLFPVGKLRNSVNGHGGVKIGEYHNSCSYLCSSSIPDCSSVVCLLSLKYQRGKRVEHPFPVCYNSLSFATVPWCARETREAAGTSQLQKDKRKNLQPTAGGVRKSLCLIIFPALN